MTNEQAIAELQKEHDLIQGKHDLDGSQFAPALLEALAMAIEVMSGKGDTISRQAALAALDKRFDSVPVEQTTEILMLRKDLRELPSAQPELITCKDCYWWTKQEDSLQGRCDLMGIYPTGGWYCGNAKR